MMREVDSIMKEAREMGELSHKYLRLGILIVLLSAMPFFVGSVINILGILLNLSIIWRLAGLVLVLIAIGCVVMAIVFLRKASYWNKQWNKKLSEELLETWERETIEHWQNH